MNLQNVIIRKLFYSQYANRGYGLAPQRHYVTEADISTITNIKELYYWWKDFIDDCGWFELIDRGRKGRFGKRIAILIVTPDSIGFENEKCPLAKYFTEMYYYS